MIGGKSWLQQHLCKVCKNMTNLMVVSLKTDGRPSSHESITKEVLSGGGSGAKGSQPKFER